MAEFARLWTTFTGRRVIGLTTSTNAARVLQHEGLAESYNIAEFLGKTEGSDELRRPVPLHQNDVLVLDEASQLSTADLAMIEQAARQPGARGHRHRRHRAARRRRSRGNVPACWPRKSRRPAARGPPVRRGLGTAGQHPLRDGDLAAAAATTGMAASAAPTRRPPMSALRDVARRSHARQRRTAARRVNAEAAELSRRVQAKLAQMGSVGPPQAPLSDGNHAGVGDLVRARLNSEIDAGGRKLTNRDTLASPRCAGRTPRCGGSVRTEPGPGPSGCPSRIWPRTRARLRGNVHVAQGRTVDTAHLLVTDSLSRQALYVA